MDTKLWYIYTTEYYSIPKKNMTLPFVTTQMALKDIVLNEMGTSREKKSPSVTYI